MDRLLLGISAEVKERLRALSREAEDVKWPARLAAAEGWARANAAYQARQRELGCAEMRALLEALGLQPPLDAPLLRSITVAAVKLFLLTDETAAEVHVGDSHIRVDVTLCPIFSRFENPRWVGLTACGCFARRWGWYQALGIPPREVLISLRKWGDPACEFIIRMSAPVSVRVDAAAEPIASGTAGGTRFSPAA